MHELTIYPSTSSGGVVRLCIANCDKDGSILSARLASAVGGVSSTRPMDIRPDRYTDRTYFSDIANTLAGYYRIAHGSILLDMQTVVLSSVHRAGLYIAEALHAPLLPMQLISFSKNIEQAQTSQMLSIVGADYGVNDLWQWNKVVDPSQFPESYVDILRGAKHVILVRSNDSDEDCPIEGKIGNVYVTRSLRTLNPHLWDTFSDRLEGEGKDYSNLRHWEWGLPDATVTAAMSLWKSLGKDGDHFHVIESTTVDLIRKISRLWEEYLIRNAAQIRGVTLNAYWTAHPYYERYAGLVPVHYYKFSMLEDIARAYLEKYGKREASPESICCFTNTAGSELDSADVRSLLTDMGLQHDCWFSMGFDCPGAKCVDIHGDEIPKPFEMISEWIKSAPYRSNDWKPLEITTIMALMNNNTAQHTSGPLT